MRITKLTMVSAILPFVLLAGCSSNQSDKQQSKSAMQEEKASKTSKASPYMGKENQKKLEATAAAEGKSADAQIEAARSAYLNGNYDKAASYYQKAIKIDPKSYLAYNNLGNIYFRSYNKPKDAIPYYQKATELNPAYSFGWLNLALAQKAVGDTKAAQTTVNTALKKVAKTDSNYKQIQNVLNSK
ncbi:tetratricopeptide repeat protein [Bacillus sp. BRMEA1]|uniref:tetratricopeptide repeat protein n=1 Tax=Neobacillus endophyticus TaxID=2738405 RepID=UPI001564C753|nr:tetratricopeptide repeat protein [Neobacillus endophyticus]NRD77294.1 tetratricopeptide repeat protein [Neobacillus endophyticus]